MKGEHAYRDQPANQRLGALALCTLAKVCLPPEAGVGLDQVLGEDERGAFVEDLLEKAAEIDGVPVAVVRRDLMGIKRDERALSALEVHAGSPGIAAPTWRCLPCEGSGAPLDGTVSHPRPQLGLLQHLLDYHSGATLTRDLTNFLWQGGIGFSLGSGEWVNAPPLSFHVVRPLTAADWVPVRRYVSMQARHREVNQPGARCKSFLAVNDWVAIRRVNSSTARSWRSPGDSDLGPFSYYLRARYDDSMKRGQLTRSSTPRSSLPFTVDGVLGGREGKTCWTATASLIQEDPVRTP